MTKTNQSADVRGWKLYCGWGDPFPNINGWFFDDDLGMSVVNHIRNRRTSNLFGFRFDNNPAHVYQRITCHLVRCRGLRHHEQGPANQVNRAAPGTTGHIK